MATKTICFFISSTFNDMHAERDVIRKRVIPWLREDLKEYSVDIQVTDLRWGVNTVGIDDEEERESKVLHVCIDSIHNSKPFFIALLGERYGWIPPVERVNNVAQVLDESDVSMLGDLSERKSVTEMEIMLGALGKHNLMEHSFFCQRSIDSYKGMPEAKKKLYIDSLSDNELVRQSADKLVALKERINNQCKQAGTTNHIIDYSAQWNDRKNKFVKLNSLAKRLHDQLLKAIIYDIKADNDVVNYTDSDQDKLESFIDSHVNGFCGFDDYLEDQIKFLTQATQMESVLNRKTGKFIIGFSGCGKSSMLCMLYRKLQKKSSKSPFYPLIHVAGITPKSTLSGEMIGNWCRQIQDYLGERPQSSSGDKKLLNTLLTRLQAKGLIPIVLIDSLDSFVRNRDIIKFDFLPFNVPFICTSLPGYPDEIVKSQPQYSIEKMRLFGQSEAQQLISITLENNKRELSQDVQDLLLSKKNNSKQPAYTSPLWLKLALAILMELGSEDFLAIHKIKRSREDEKIETFLAKTIQEIPTEADKLFSYFVTMSCRYFNKEITMESLSYIAIAQYGVRESLLQDIIGNHWDQLEFNSLRYWLRDFIQCNNMNHRWFFNHAILRDVMFRFNKTLVNQCKKKLINYLLKSKEKPRQDIEELIYQLLIHREFQLLHDTEPDFRGYFGRIFFDFMRANKDVAMDFLYDYIKAYYANSDLIESIKNHLLDEGMSLSDPSYLDLMDEITQLQVSQFADADLKKSTSVVNHYFEAFACRSERLYFARDNKKDEKYVDFFLPLQQTFFRLKKYYGNDIYTYDVWGSFFSYWRNAIHSLKMICRYEDRYQSYSDNLLSFINESFTFCFKFRTPEDFCISLESMLGERCELPYQESIQMSLLAHDRLFDILTAMYKEHSLEVSDGLSQSMEKMVKSYLVHFNDPADVTITPLMAMMGIDKAQVLHILNDINEWRHRWDADLNQGGFSGVIKQVNPEEMGEEWLEESMDASSNNVSDPDEEELELDGEALRLEINKAEAEMDHYIKEHGHQLNNDDEVLDELIKQCLRVVKLNLKAGNWERAINQLHQSGSLAVSSIVRMSSNYSINTDAQNIIDYCNLIGKIGYVKEQLQHAESIANSLLHSYYHHPDGLMQRELNDYLLDLYEKRNMLDEKISFLENVFDICCRAHIENRYDTLESNHRGIRHLRDVLSDYLSALKESGRIKDAVIVLERWLELCQIVYADNLDIGDAYEFIDETYDILAGLYDGTPALVEGMEERNSIFLQDPYIMVTRNNKWGYLNHDGSIAIPLIYDGAWKAEQDNLSVCKDGKWGYLDLKGNILLDSVGLNMDVAIPIRHGWGLVRQYGNWALFSLSGDIVDITPRVYSLLGIYPGGMVKAQIRSKDQLPHMDFLLNDGHTFLFNGRMETVKSPNLGVIVAQYQEGCDDIYTALFDTQGKELSRPKRYYSIGAFGKQLLAPAKTVDGQAGYLNHAGQEVTSFKYDASRPFSEGLGAVAIPGPHQSLRWGFVNELGEEVIKPQYVSVGDFHEGLAWVCVKAESTNGFGYRGSKFGFINPQGKMIISPFYDDVSSFLHGQALIWRGEELMHLSLCGKRLSRGFFKGMLAKGRQLMDRIEDRYYEKYYTFLFKKHINWNWYAVRRAWNHFWSRIRFGKW